MDNLNGDNVTKKEIKDGIFEMEGHNNYGKVDSNHFKDTIKKDNKVNNDFEVIVYCKDIKRMVDNNYKGDLKNENVKG